MLNRPKRALNGMMVKVTDYSNLRAQNPCITEVKYSLEVAEKKSEYAPAIFVPP